MVINANKRLTKEGIKKKNWGMRFATSLKAINQKEMNKPMNLLNII